jgi:hypothetical protein
MRARGAQQLWKGTLGRAAIFVQLAISDFEGFGSRVCLDFCFAPISKAKSPDWSMARMHASGSHAKNNRRQKRSGALWETRNPDFQKVGTVVASP